ncbi:MAG: hypothetical protein AAF632_28055, partial [Bacteroidota bacterium]
LIDKRFPAPVRGSSKAKFLSRFENSALYNEYVYFYPFAQEALYDIEGRGNDTILHFEHKSAKGATYNIKLIGKEKSYTLKIEDILLNVYSTGVGVISFHLKNTQYNKKEDILNINQYGRRIFPPFLGKSDPNRPVLNAKSAGQLADKIFIAGIQGDLSDDFEEFSKLKDYSIKPISDVAKELNYHLVPKFIRNLLPENTRQAFRIKPVLEDRMFVLCWYENNTIIDHLIGNQASVTEEMDTDTGKFDNDPIAEEEGKYGYLDSDYWYRYLFVDGPGKSGIGASNNQFQKELIRERTYPRWIENGSIIGVCRYAFVILTNDEAQPYISAPLETMYYKMVELCLVQRASIIEFSRRIAEITYETSGDTQEVVEDARELTGECLHFTDNIYFSEITPQEQGIELYDMLHKHLRIEKAAKDLNQEVAELYNYVNLVEERKRNKINYKRTEAINRLTVVAAILAIPALIFGYYSLPLINNQLVAEERAKLGGVLSLTLIACVLIFFAFRKTSNWKEVKNSTMIYLSLGFILLLLLLPFIIETRVSDEETSNDRGVDDLQLTHPIIININDSTQVTIDSVTFTPSTTAKPQP